MSALELPANLVRAAERDHADATFEAWIAALPVLVGDLSRRWSLAVGRPFQPGGVTSWVAPARNPAGEHLVLKVGWRHDEALHEADALRLWDGVGAVRLLDALTFGAISALLIEACEPGTALSDAVSPPEQDVVVADLLRRLWVDPPPAHPFRSLQCMCDRWAGEFEDDYVALCARTPVLEPGLARAGTELLRSLPGSAERCVLLCTDLHPGNVLAARREPWLAVDPKPYVGDPTYDPIQHMLNFPDRLRGDPAGFAHRMAGLLDLDAERLLQWLFARCVQESIDDPGWRSLATELAP